MYVSCLSISKLFSYFYKTRSTQTDKHDLESLQFIRGFKIRC